jgi:hypothetical protein
MKIAETFTIFDEVTRKPISRVTCDKELISVHVKEGQLAILGRYDAAVLLSPLGTVVADQQHARDLAKSRRRDACLMRIEELERKMLRRVRELLAADDPMMKEFDDEAAALRSIIDDNIP